MRKQKRPYIKTGSTATALVFDIMNDILEKSEKLRKKYKGKIGIDEVISELKTNGFDTVFFNTPKGNAVLEAYGIEPQADAFTYNGATRVVFVDNNLCVADKLYVLLHELGHIVLKHIGSGSAQLLDIQLSELEADTFALAMLRPPKKRKMFTAFICLSVVAAFLVGLSINIPPLHTAENVYITQSGGRYHRINCVFVKNNSYAELPIDEAVKVFEPCSICNP